MTLLRKCSRKREHSIPDLSLRGVLLLMFPAVVANPISDESLFELPSISVALSCVDPLPEDFDVISSRPSASCCALSETFIFDESTSGSVSSPTTAGDRIGTGTDEGDGIESGHTDSKMVAVASSSSNSYSSRPG